MVKAVVGCDVFGDYIECRFDVIFVTGGCVIAGVSTFVDFSISGSVLILHFVRIDENKEIDECIKKKQQ